MQVDFGRYMAVYLEGLYRGFDAALTGNDFVLERIEDRISMSGVSVNGGLAVP